MLTTRNPPLDTRLFYFEILAIVSQQEILPVLLRAKGDDDSLFPRALWIPESGIYMYIVYTVSYLYKLSLSSFIVFFSLVLLFILVASSLEFARFLVLLVHKSSFGADDRIHDTRVPLWIPRTARNSNVPKRSFKVSSSRVCPAMVHLRSLWARPTRVRTSSSPSCLA